MAAKKKNEDYIVRQYFFLLQKNVAHCECFSVEMILAIFAKFYQFWSGFNIVDNVWKFNYFSKILTMF